MYHWNQLELARYFDINEGLTPANARAVYDAVNEKLALPEFSARNLVKNSNVEALCTTDDPASDLAAHDQVRDEGFSVKVLPTFRPDQSLNITAPGFIPYLEKAGVHNWQQLTKWLDSRMDYFALRGCRLSDHSLSRVPYGRGDAAAVLEKRLNGGELTDGEVQLYQTELMKVLAAGYSKRGWVMQLHIGALRNNNTAMFNKIGPDTGFDSMDDMPIAANLSALLNCMAMEGCLPKTVLYGLNPAYNSVLASMAGNFQSGPEAGRIQYGAAWWFNDHRDGMEEQLRTLGNLGILGRFVGMLTDSRSFVSYPRHEYFRRILCNLLGQWVERGEYPNDPAALEMLVKGICHDNAQRYFGF